MPWALQRIGFRRDAIASPDLLDERIHPVESVVDGQQVRQAVLVGVSLPAARTPVPADHPSRHRVPEVDGPDGVEHGNGQALRVPLEGLPLVPRVQTLLAGAYQRGDVNLLRPGQVVCLEPSRPGQPDIRRVQEGRPTAECFRRRARLRRRLGSARGPPSTTSVAGWL